MTETFNLAPVIQLIPVNAAAAWAAIAGIVAALAAAVTVKLSWTRNA